MTSLGQRLSASIAYRWAKLQYHHAILAARGLLSGGEPGDGGAVSKTAERRDLLRPDFRRTYRGILAWQRQERARVRVDCACAQDGRHEQIQRAYDERVSHEGVPGRSRSLQFEMVWETVWPLLHLDLQRGMRVADVGAENSCLPLYLAYLGCESHALDLFLGGYGEHFRERVLALCQDGELILGVMDVKGAASQATYRCDDITALSVGDDSFDRIVCVSTLEHVPNDAAAARELARVLKPGGLLAVTVPFAAHYEQRSDEPHHKGPEGRWRGDLGRVYSREALFSRIVRPSGLQIVGPYDFALGPTRHLPGQSRDVASAALFVAKPPLLRTSRPAPHCAEG